MSSINTISPCYGCRGCEGSCPFQALSFVDDEHQLPRPTVDDSKCTGCSLCLKKCNDRLDPHVPRESYLFEADSTDEILRSSSGGAFGALAKLFFSNYSNGLVCGVTYDDNLKVHREFASSQDEIERFRKSKYVASDNSGIFAKIAEYLREGRVVLFIGTPCEIAGLRKYLDSNQSRLITIDLLCTGVLSPVIFRKFLDTYHTDIESYDWRYKHPIANGSWNIMDSSATIRSEIVQDPYIIALKKLYGRRYGFKESCYSCKYSSSSRYGDITLGDWWTAERVFQDGPNIGTSTILANSEIGVTFVRALMETTHNIKAVAFSDIINQNPALSHPCVRPTDNDIFWSEVSSQVDFRDILIRFTRVSLSSRIKSGVAALIPDSMIHLIRRIRSL